MQWTVGKEDVFEQFHREVRVEVLAGVGNLLQLILTRHDNECALLDIRHLLAGLHNLIDIDFISGNITDLPKKKPSFFPVDEPWFSKAKRNCLSSGWKMMIRAMNPRLKKAPRISGADPYAGGQ